VLSYSLMGFVALAVVWTAALLLAAAALQDDRRIAALAQRLARAARKEGAERLLFGRVTSAGDAFATWRVEQVGRAIDTPKGVGVQWNDRAYASLVHGGAIDSVPVAARAEDVAVWVADERRAAASAVESPEAFEQVTRAGRTGRGALRTFDLSIAAGAEAWAFGALEGGALVPPVGAPLLVAERDPRAFCTKARIRIWVFVVAELAVLAGLTALCFVPPVFEGVVSKLGGVGCLAFFLGVQPIGSWNVKNASRWPHEAFLRGEWLPTAATRDQRRPSSAARTRATSTEGT
jgi:hypothetical protein